MYKAVTQLVMKRVSSTQETKDKAVCGTPDSSTFCTMCCTAVSFLYGCVALTSSNKLPKERKCTTASD